MSRELRTPRLVLHAFEPQDEQTLLLQWNDPEVRRFLFDDQPVSREAVREQIEASRRSFEGLGCGFFTIRLAEGDERVIGFAGLPSRALLPDHARRARPRLESRAIGERKERRR